MVIDSSLPHLMALEDDVLSTGVVLYHLKVSRPAASEPPSSRGQGGKRQGQQPGVWELRQMPQSYLQVCPQETGRGTQL